jgi:hypothetical protein
MTPEERATAIQAGGPDRGKALVAALRGHLAKTLKLRPATVQSWGVAQIADSTLRAPLGEDVLADLLIAFHLVERVPLLSAFLDTAGIPHTDGATEPGYTVAWTRRGCWPPRTRCWPTSRSTRAASTSPRWWRGRRGVDAAGAAAGRIAEVAGSSVGQAGS